MESWKFASGNLNVHLPVSQMNAPTTGQETRLLWSNCFSLLLKTVSLCRKLRKIYSSRHKKSRSEFSVLLESLNKVHKLLWAGNGCSQLVDFALNWTRQCIKHDIQTLGYLLGQPQCGLCRQTSSLSRESSSIRVSIQTSGALLTKRNKKKFLIADFKHQVTLHDSVEHTVWISEYQIS